MTTVHSDSRFQIYRFGDAHPFEHDDTLQIEGLTPVIAAGLQNWAAAADSLGAQTRVLINLPGFSLTHVWFKSGFPLPLHTHNADCLYYVVGGELTLGTETLGAGDGVFVPAETPYKFTPGEAGVEVLEFRHATQFNMRFMDKTAKAWMATAKRMKEASQVWENERSPALSIL
jgi:mannose-6-phosphate isomerase-like protein (cupin superfamily)